MRKLIVFVSFVAVMLGIAVPGWSCTDIVPLPQWVDPATPASDLPCVRLGMATEEPASVVVYLPDGDLGFIRPDGAVLRRGHISDSGDSKVPQSIVALLLIGQVRDQVAYWFTDVMTGSLY